MGVLGEVLKDLLKMFWADARMSAAALAVVALAWGVARWAGGPGLAAGAALALGALAVLVASVASAARAAARRRR